MPLPLDKIDKLSDNISKKLTKVLKDEYKTLRNNEVNEEDATEIIQDGWDKSSGRPFKD